MRPAGCLWRRSPSGRQRLRIEGRAPLRGRAILQEAVTAIDVDILYALTAAANRTHTRVPFPWAGALTGVCLRGDAIGRRTRARSVGGGGRTAVGLTGRSTVGATGIAWRRGIGRRRAIGWRGYRLEERYRLEEAESRTGRLPSLTPAVVAKMPTPAIAIRAMINLPLHQHV